MEARDGTEHDSPAPASLSVTSTLWFCVKPYLERALSHAHTGEKSTGIHFWRLRDMETLRERSGIYSWLCGGIYLWFCFCQRRR